MVWVTTRAQFSFGLAEGSGSSVGVEGPPLIELLAGASHVVFGDESGDVVGEVNAASHVSRVRNAYGARRFRVRVAAFVVVIRSFSVSSIIRARAGESSMSACALGFLHAAKTPWQRSM